MGTSRMPDLHEVTVFLEGLHGAPVTDVEPLSGGYWSSAFGYVADGRELVARFGEIRDGFEIDRAAMAFSSDELPVPEMLDVGDAFGGSYAISIRHVGRFLEDVRPDEADVTGPTLERLLAALRRAPVDRDGPSSWCGDGASTWREWVLARLVDDPDRLVSGWRETLAADPDIDELFRACEARIGELVPLCPERRDLVHGDLLNRNVLVSDDASEVTAVFSWKCSALGDFLFDVAWCTFWGAWHPGIAAIDIWKRTITSADPDDTVDADLRHHCYELQIGAGHLGWHAWTGDADGLRAVAERTRLVLERGPLSPRLDP